MRFYYCTMAGTIRMLVSLSIVTLLLHHVTPVTSRPTDQPEGGHARPLNPDYQALQTLLGQNLAGSPQEKAKVVDLVLQLLSEIDLPTLCDVIAQDTNGSFKDLLQASSKIPEQPQDLVIPETRFRENAGLLEIPASSLQANNIERDQISQQQANLLLSTNGKGKDLTAIPYSNSQDTGYVQEITTDGKSSSETSIYNHQINPNVAEPVTNKSGETKIRGQADDEPKFVEVVTVPQDSSHSSNTVLKKTEKLNDNFEQKSGKELMYPLLGKITDSRLNTKLDPAQTVRELKQMHLRFMYRPGDYSDNFEDGNSIDAAMESFKPKSDGLERPLAQVYAKPLMLGDWLNDKNPFYGDITDYKENGAFGENNLLHNSVLDNDNAEIKFSPIDDKNVPSNSFEKVFVNPGSSNSNSFEKVFVNPGSSNSNSFEKVFVNPGSSNSNSFEKVFVNPSSSNSNSFEKVFVNPDSSNSNSFEKVFVNPGSSNSNSFEKVFVNPSSSNSNSFEKVFVNPSSSNSNSFEKVFVNPSSSNSNKENSVAGWNGWELETKSGGIGLDSRTHDMNQQQNDLAENLIREGAYKPDGVSNQITDSTGLDDHRSLNVVSWDGQTVKDKEPMVPDQEVGKNVRRVLDVAKDTIRDIEMSTSGVSREEKTNMQEKGLREEKTNMQEKGLREEKTNMQEKGLREEKTNMQEKGLREEKTNMQEKGLKEEKTNMQEKGLREGEDKNMQEKGLREGEDRNMKLGKGDLLTTLPSKITSKDGDYMKASAGAGFAQQSTPDVEMRSGKVGQDTSQRTGDLTTQSVSDDALLESADDEVTPFGGKAVKINDNKAQNGEQVVSTENRTAKSDENVISTDDRTAKYGEQVVSTDDRTAKSDENVISTDDRTAKYGEQVVSTDDRTAQYGEQVVPTDSTRTEYDEQVATANVIAPNLDNQIGQTNNSFTQHNEQMIETNDHPTEYDEQIIKSNLSTTTYDEGEGNTRNSSTGAYEQEYMTDDLNTSPHITGWTDDSSLISTTAGHMSIDSSPDEETLAKNENDILKQVNLAGQATINAIIPVKYLANENTTSSLGYEREKLEATPAHHGIRSETYSNRIDSFRSRESLTEPSAMLTLANSNIKSEITSVEKHSTALDDAAGRNSEMVTSRYDVHGAYRILDSDPRNETAQGNLITNSADAIKNSEPIREIKMLESIIPSQSMSKPNESTEIYTNGKGFAEDANVANSDDLDTNNNSNNTQEYMKNKQIISGLTQALAGAPDFAKNILADQNTNLNVSPDSASVAGHALSESQSNDLKLSLTDAGQLVNHRDNALVSRSDNTLIGREDIVKHNFGAENAINSLTEAFPEQNFHLSDMENAHTHERDVSDAKKHTKPMRALETNQLEKLDLTRADFAYVSNFDSDVNTDRDSAQEIVTINSLPQESVARQRHTSGDFLIRSMPGNDVTFDRLQKMSSMLTAAKLNLSEINLNLQNKLQGNIHSDINNNDINNKAINVPADEISIDNLAFEEIHLSTIGPQRSNQNMFRVLSEDNIPSVIAYKNVPSDSVHPSETVPSQEAESVLEESVLEEPVSGDQTTATFDVSPSTETLRASNPTTFVAVSIDPSPTAENPSQDGETSAYSILDVSRDDGTPISTLVDPFTKVDVATTFSATDLPQANVETTTFSANDLSKVDVETMNFSATDLPQADAETTTFSATDLPQADVETTTFSATDLPQADVETTTFSATDLPQADAETTTFSATDLPQVDAETTTFSATDLPQADVETTTFSATDLPQADAETTTFSATDLPHTAVDTTTSSVVDVSNKAGDTSTLSIANIALKTNETSTFSTEDVSNKVDEKSTFSQEEVTEKVDEKSTFSQEDVSNKVDQKSTFSQEEVTEKVDLKSTFSQEDVSKKVDEKSALSQEDVSNKTAESSTESSLNHPNSTDETTTTNILDLPQAKEISPSSLSSQFQNSNDTSETSTSDKMDLSQSDKTTSSSELKQSSLPDVRTPSSELKQSSLPDVRTPSSELKQSSLPDVKTPYNELKQSSLPDVRTPSSELKQSSLPDVRTPSSELKQSSLPDVRTPSNELKQSSLPDVRTPSNELKQSSLPDVKTPSNEMKQSSLPDVKTPSNELKQSSLPHVRTPSNELKQSSLPDVRTPSNELKQSSLPDVKTPSNEMKQSSLPDVKTPSNELKQSSLPHVRTPSSELKQSSLPDETSTPSKLEQSPKEETESPLSNTLGPNSKTDEKSASSTHGTSSQTSTYNAKTSSSDKTSELQQLSSTNQNFADQYHRYGSQDVSPHDTSDRHRTASINDELADTRNSVYGYDVHALKRRPQAIPYTSKITNWLMQENRPPKPTPFIHPWKAYNIALGKHKVKQNRNGEIKHSPEIQLYRGFDFDQRDGQIKEHSWKARPLSEDELKNHHQNTLSNEKVDDNYGKHQSNDVELSISTNDETKLPKINQPMNSQASKHEFGHQGDNSFNLNYDTDDSYLHKSYPQREEPSKWVHVDSNLWTSTLSQDSNNVGATDLGSWDDIGSEDVLQSLRNRHLVLQQTEDFPAGDKFDSNDFTVYKVASKGSGVQSDQESGQEKLKNSFLPTSLYAGDPGPSYAAAEKGEVVSDWLNLSSQSGPTSVDSVPAPKDYQCPDLFGYHRDPENCQAFFICSWGMPHRVVCPAGTLYNHKLAVCDWAVNVKCLN